MNSHVRSVLAAIAAGVALAGCATYDYGYGYTYPSYGYNDGYGPYYYDYGPSYYVGPSVGLGFAYRDDHRDHYRHYDHNDDRNYDWHRRDNDNRRGDNDRWSDRDPGQDQARPMNPPGGREDPWGGSNIPFGRNSQQ